MYSVTLFQHHLNELVKVYRTVGVLVHVPDHVAEILL